MTYAAAKTADSQDAIRARILVALTGTSLAGLSDSAPQRVLVDDVSGWLATQAGIRADLAKSIDVSDPDTSDDDWIDLFAAPFDETRFPAFAAVWDVPIGGSGTVGPTTKITLQTSGGIYFDCTQAAAVTLPAPVRFTARTAGAVGNVPASSFTRVITGPAGISIAGSGSQYTSGSDRESNSALVKRCLGKWALLGTGWTLDAFDYLIPKACPTITRHITRGDAPLGLGTVASWLGNSSGPALPAEVALVQAALGNSRKKPLGSGAYTALAAAADALTINAVLDGDGSNSTLAADAAAALVALCNAIPPGPAVLDDSVVRGVVLGGRYTSIPVVCGSEVKTIRPALPGFSGAASVVSLSLSAPHAVPSGYLLVPTVNVTVV